MLCCRGQQGGVGYFGTVAHVMICTWPGQLYGVVYFGTGGHVMICTWPGQLYDTNISISHAARGGAKYLDRRWGKWGHRNIKCSIKL